MSVGRSMKWSVHLRAHVVGGTTVPSHRRWEIPEGDFVGNGETREAGIADAIRQAHRKEGVAAWKPYLRQSTPFVARAELAPLTALEERQKKIMERKAKR